MAPKHPVEMPPYDVVISFAGEDRAVADRRAYVLESHQGEPLPRTVQNPPSSVQPGFRSVRSKIS